MSLYFAYGSNLDRLDWSQFCACHNADPQCMMPIGPALLPDFELVFNFRSARRNGGALNVRPRKGHVVRGALFEVDDRGWEVLDIKESVADGCYARVNTVAILQNGTTVPVLTYVVRPERTEDFVEPSDLYNEAVRRGLSAHGWNSEQYDAAARGSRPAPDVEGVFVYGTLLRGESRAEVIERHGPRSVRQGHMRGTLYETAGDYPMLDLGDGDGETVETGIVRGEIVDFEDLSNVLQSLDDIEAFFGYSNQNNEYLRTLIDVDTGGLPPVRAWTYVAADTEALGERIESGCWRTFRDVPVPES